MTELERCRPWIEAALEHDGGSHTFDDVAGMILSGDMQLWPGERGCMVTEIVSYPQRRVLNIAYAGGELAQFRAMEPSVRAWAKAQGCTAVTLRGRKGWLRVLPGWKHLHTVMESEI